MEFLKNYKKGTFITIETKRDAKVKKSCDVKIEKISIYKNARLGISYDNISQTQEKRQIGEAPKTNAGLPWGEWKIDGYVITHKGNDYLRIYADRDLIETTWLVNGIETSKEEISKHLLSSEINSNIKDKYLTLTINQINIMNVF